MEDPGFGPMRMQDDPVSVGEVMQGGVQFGLAEIELASHLVACGRTSEALKRRDEGMVDARQQGVGTHDRTPASTFSRLLITELPI